MPENTKPICICGKSIENHACYTSELGGKSVKDVLIEILAKAESMETAREVRHLIKARILNVKE